jgi:hypothetical protein
MELKPKGISAIEVAGQPVRLKAALKLLDAILTRSSGTFAETFSGESAKYAGSLVVPTGIEPVLPT